MTEIISEHKKVRDRNSEFRIFKERYSIRKVVAIIGGSQEQIGLSYSDLISEVFKYSMESGYRFAVLTGGTKGGVPEMGIRVARELNLPTVGVFPEGGAKYVLESLLDFSVRVPAPIYRDVVWGSESVVLTACIDGAIVVGGEWGTMTEISMIMKSNVSRIKRGEKPVLVMPIVGSGGAADVLGFLAKDLNTVRGSIEPVNDVESFKRVLRKVFAE